MKVLTSFLWPKNGAKANPNDHGPNGVITPPPSQTDNVTVKGTAELLKV